MKSIKKFLPVTIICFLSINFAYGAIDIQLLGKMENNLFGFEYTSQSDTQRVERIEKEVYGNVSSGDLNKRIAKLNKDLGAELIGQEIEPCEDTFLREEEYKEVLSSQEANIDYPVINELEKAVFNSENKNIGVKDRLAKLENKVFSKTYPNEDLSTRVDRLRDKIQPSSLNKIADSDSDDFYTSGYYPPAYDYDGMEIGGMSNSYGYDYNNYSPYSMYSANNNKKPNLNSIERSLYKKNFKSDDMQNRLARVEQSMFGETFTDEDDQTRINRISSAYYAQKSSAKYDSNKFAQNMSTAMQIGTMILMILACIL